MENSFFQTAEKLNNEHRRTRRWHKVITVMAAIVVFCTTYALILPAITWERSLLCDMKEHTHTASCYAETVITPEKRELVCTAAEHTHGDSCYEEVTTYVCGLEEDETHQHTADCMQTERVLTCEQSEHTHSDDCYHITPAVTEKQLVCAKPEHVHTDACFDAPPSSDSGYYCGCVAHTHNKNCYFEDGTLRCTMKEHTHTLSCQINKSADVETANEWERTFADVKLSGIMREDVLAIAKTQLGYTESTKNFVIDDEKTGDVRGYTRYGAWYGDPYGDWCAMFCAFCMSHAGVKDFPLESNCQTWIEALDEIKMYHKVGTYDPKPGDLVFYCWDEPEEGKERGGDHVGFVYEIVDAVEATETTAAKPAYLRTIEGNWGDCVATVERELNSPDIIGYGEMPKAFTSTFNDDDFTVVAKYDADAKIPADAQLKAEKIPADSELYQQYYQQSVEAMLRNTPATSEEELAISYLQFYDIGFYVNGKEIEPAGPVNIVIATKDEVKIKNDEVANAIHFGEDGTEVLSVDTAVPAEQDAESAFSFTQESFSVTAVVVSGTNYFATGSLSDGDKVVVSTWRNGTTYYLTNTTVNNTLSLTTNKDYATVWTIANVDGILRLRNNTGNYVTVDGNGAGLGNSYRGNLRYVSNGGYWEVFCNNPDVYLNQPYANSNYASSSNASGANNEGSRWVILKQGGQVTRPIVWLDGTNGQLMNLIGSPNENYSDHLTQNQNGTYSLKLPTSWSTPVKYDYTLIGWYDVVNHKYYAPGETATVTQNTVFYADWRPTTYDVGEKNNQVITDVDTKSFITTEVFDYSALFDVMSTTVTSNISASEHTENWVRQETGENAYTGELPLDFMFIDYDWSGSNRRLVSYQEMNEWNTNHGLQTKPDVISHVQEVSGKNLLDILFNPANSFDPQTKTGYIGVNYVGQGDQLYHYMEDGMSNFDGKHNGYYYYDSTLNAASYNQTEQRFYVYDYLERTSDSKKDGGGGEYSDFLPFNSPYANTNGHNIVQYSVPGHSTTNYQYDAKGDGTENRVTCELANVNANYFFGFHTDVQFYLPNDSGYQDSKGNYGNQSIKGEDMNFEFAGDDDVWIFVDDDPVLDIGGMHGIRSGSINFSTGEITVYNDHDIPTITTKTFSSGEHKLSIYYMERGSSQSNCQIYFNLPPRFTLNLHKEDAFTAEALNGAEFSFFTDAACTKPALLWHNEAEYRAAYTRGGESAANEASTNTFTILNGRTSCWGLAAGQTYYLKETRTPDGAYVTAYDTVCVSLDARGDAEYKAFRIDGGPNGSGDGEEDINVKGFDVDSQTKSLDVTATNRQSGTKQLTVTKQWASGSSNIPNTVTVRLLQNGVPIGDTVTLRKSENWKHTWLGLPGTDENDVAYEYSIEEYPVPAGYVSSGQRTDHEGDRIAYQLTNTPIPEDNRTSVEVTKTWNDGSATNHPSVTFHLYADGKDTGRTLTLPISGNWTGTLEGLPLKDSGGHTIKYTVVEDAMAGYSPVYSDVTSDVHMVTPPSSGAVGTWKTVNVTNASVMEVGGIYRFLSDLNGQAMTDVGQNAKPEKRNTNDGDKNQQWKVISNDGSEVVLQNVGSERYLYHETNSTFTSSQNSTSAFKILNNRIHWQYYQSQYYHPELEIMVYSWGYQIAEGTNIGTQFTIQKLNTVAPEPIEGNPYYTTTVTNHKVDVIQVTVYKNWTDGDFKHPNDPVTVHLLANNKDTGQSLTLNAQNSWTGKFTGLNKSYYDADGEHEIVYTVIEDFVAGYDSDVQSTQNSQGYTVTVTNSPESYALPETGGDGLIPIYASGILLMAGAWMCGYFLRRKAERRHR